MCLWKQPTIKKKKRSDVIFCLKFLVCNYWLYNSVCSQTWWMICSRLWVHVRFDHWPPDETTWCCSAPVWLFSFHRWLQAPEQGQGCFSAHLPGRSSLSASGTVLTCSLPSPSSGRRRKISPGSGARRGFSLNSLRKPPHRNRVNPNRFQKSAPVDELEEWKSGLLLLIYLFNQLFLFWASQNSCDDYLIEKNHWFLLKALSN